MENEHVGESVMLLVCEITHVATGPQKEGGNTRQMRGTGSPVLSSEFSAQCCSFIQLFCVLTQNPTTPPHSSDLISPTHTVLNINCVCVEPLISLMHTPHLHTVHHQHNHPVSSAHPVLGQHLWPSEKMKVCLVSFPD